MRNEPLLYDLTDSPFCAKARIALNLKGITWRRVTLTIGRVRELKRLSPVGKVPVLVDGTRVVPDSSAILRYLEEQHPEPSLLPNDPAARAYCGVLEDWADEALYPIVGAFKWLNRENRARALAATVDEIAHGPLRPLVALAMVRRIRRRFAVLGIRETSLADLTSRMRESLRNVDTLLEGRPFLLGRQPLLCDIAVFAQLSWMRGYVEGRLLDHAPAVVAWLDRMSGIPAVDAACSP
jgi:glutathione S-transferase